MKNLKVKFNDLNFYFINGDIVHISKLDKDYLYLDTFSIWKPCDLEKIPYGKDYEQVEETITIESEEEFDKFKLEYPVPTNYQYNPALAKDMYKRKKA